jgi:1-phosphofructokinase
VAETGAVGDPHILDRSMSTVVVFAPSPMLTVTVEQGAGEDAEIHLHAGGQGFWVARMAAALGAQPTICVPLGGETGTVLEPLLANASVEVLSVPVGAPNGCYIHDRRTGSRTEVAATPSAALQRHELDALYGAALTAGLMADVTLLTGPRHEKILPAEIYTRLASDLRGNGRLVLADLSGPALAAALEGGVDLLKLSSDEAFSEGLARGDSTSAVIDAVRRLHQRGASDVLISRAAEPAIALVGGRVLEIAGPRFQPLDPSGAGDSMFAALGVGLADGLDREAALRLSVAAGALNVTRHGLGSGQRGDVDRLLDSVVVTPVPAGESGLPGP